MELTASEDQVVQCLRRGQVAQGAQLAAQLQLSLKTVQRTLAKVGYYTSLNYNSTFVTLQDIPQFDEFGLWNYQRICFSRLGKLPQTLVHLVEQAPQGCTVHQLEEWVGTRVHNHLSQLLRQGRLGHFRLGRQAVYTSADARRQQQQQQARQRDAAPAERPQHGPTRASRSGGPDGDSRPRPPTANPRSQRGFPGQIPASARRRGAGSADSHAVRLLPAKKNDPLKAASLLQSAGGHSAGTADGPGLRRPVPSFRPGVPRTRVQKTTRRQVVTRELADFKAVEVVRTEPHGAGHLRSPLADLVPKGGTYGYDVMTHVGCETFPFDPYLLSLIAAWCGQRRRSNGCCRSPRDASQPTRPCLA